MADDSLDCVEAPSQAAFDLVNPLVDEVNAGSRIGVAVEIHDLAFGGIAHSDLVDILKEAVGVCDLLQRFGDRSNPRRGGILSRQFIDLQRFDMRIDFDIVPKFLLDRCLKPGGDFMCGGE